MNPYESPNTEPPHLDKPVEAGLAYHHPIWQRLLAVLVPAVGGVLAFAAIDSYRENLPLVAFGELALSAAMLFLAWRCTR